MTSRFHDEPTFYCRSCECEAPLWAKVGDLCFLCSPDVEDMEPYYEMFIADLDRMETTEKIAWMKEGF